MWPFCALPSSRHSTVQFPEHFQVDHESHCLRDLLLESAYFTDDDEDLVFLGFTSDSSHLVSLQLSHDAIPLEIVFWRFLRKPLSTAPESSLPSSNQSNHRQSHARIYPTLFVRLTERSFDSRSDPEAEFSMVLSPRTCDFPELMYYEDAEGDHFCLTVHSPDSGGLFVWALTPKGLERQGVELPLWDPTLCLGLTHATEQLPFAKSHLPHARYFVFCSHRATGRSGFLLGILPNSIASPTHNSSSCSFRRSTSKAPPATGSIHVLHLSLWPAPWKGRCQFAYPVPCMIRPVGTSISSSPNCRILRCVPQHSLHKEVLFCGGCYKCFEGSVSLDTPRRRPALAQEACECEEQPFNWTSSQASSCVCCARSHLPHSLVGINIMAGIPDVPPMNLTSPQCPLRTEPEKRLKEIETFDSVLLDDLPRVVSCCPLSWGCVVQREADQSDVSTSYFQHARFAHYHPAWAESYPSELVPFRHNALEPYVSDFEGFLPGYSADTDDLVLVEELTFSCPSESSSANGNASIQHKIFHEASASQEDDEEEEDEDENEDDAGMWLCVDSDILCQWGPDKYAKLNLRRGSLEPLTRVHFLAWRSQIRPDISGLYRLDNTRYRHESCNEFSDPTGRIAILR